MSEDSPRIVSDEIRYQGLAVDDREWMLEFLADQESGVLGLVDEGSPHLVTQLFVYDDRDGAIYLHGAQGGRSYDIVDREGEVPACFTTSRMGRFVPADRPVDFTVEYASVVAYGTVEVSNDFAEKHRVLGRFMEKFAPHLSPGKDYDEMSDESIDRTAVYRFGVDSWSAKKGEEPPDHPDAYELESVRESE
ncbi:pyridoxamine 5'-phosphate oxidase family protein [Halovivax sp.]|uniref:pyridoxamine 5'-phosphate oxidase family protein n=1 Tax=Halovivax sp. TaxID=1935978 RepID=UPI0025BA9693|nr:pyridoxamine 5'-phosphate oxidase family protein [Halovivax sp.]